MKYTDEFKEIWEQGIIVFDTCSLGRMYEWEYNHAINIKDALSYLNSNQHIWETEYNCEEFETQRNAIKDSIYQQKYENGIFKNLNKRPVPWNKIDGTLNRWEGRGFCSEFTSELNKLRLEKNIDNEEIERLRMLAQNFSFYPNTDKLFDSITQKCDINLSEEEKKNLINRYDSGKVCPGIEDKGKRNGRKYNDLFIWESIKKNAIQSNTNITFVTSDTKTDWFLDGAPRIEYIEEFEKETGKSILILTLVEFWEHCKQYIDLPIDDYILQSTIYDQLNEKYDDCYEEQICDKVQELIFETSEIADELESSLDCCVDMPVIDQIDEIKIDDISPLDYENGSDFVNVNIEMTVEITFDAQNHTGGEDWSAGCDSILFNIAALGSIPVIWSSEDTERVVLEDIIEVDKIVDISVIPSMYTEDEIDEEFFDEEDYDEGDIDGRYDF